jgi:hypothetical protein
MLSRPGANRVRLRVGTKLAGRRREGEEESIRERDRDKDREIEMGGGGGREIGKKKVRWIDGR